MRKQIRTGERDPLSFPVSNSLLSAWGWQKRWGFDNVNAKWNICTYYPRPSRPENALLTTSSCKAYRSVSTNSKRMSRGDTSDYCWTFRTLKNRVAMICRDHLRLRIRGRICHESDGHRIWAHEHCPRSGCRGGHVGYTGIDPLQRPFYVSVNSLQSSDSVQCTCTARRPEWVNSLSNNDQFGQVTSMIGASSSVFTLRPSTGINSMLFNVRVSCPWSPSLT